MKKKKETKCNKIFVLDTSVILYDHKSYKKFEENDIVIPITVLEELDNHKKGSEVKNSEARKFIKIIDKITESNNAKEWMELGKGRIKIYINKCKNHRYKNEYQVEEENKNILNIYEVFSDEEVDF